MWTWFHCLASPREFFRIAGCWVPWLGAVAGVLMAAGLYLGLFVAPPDYQQGESYRIIFIHVPAAWMSLFVYVVMAATAAVGLVWRIKLAHVVSLHPHPSALCSVLLRWRPARCGASQRGELGGCGTRG